MKKFLVLFLFLNVINASYSQLAVKGEIKGLSKEGFDKIYIYEAEAGGRLIDSSNVQNDNFLFKLGPLEAKLYMLGCGPRNFGILLWLDNQDIQVRGNVGDFFINRDSVKQERMFPKASLEGSINQQLHNSFFQSIREELTKFYNLPAGVTVVKAGEKFPFQIIAESVFSKLQSFVLTYPDKPISSFLIFYLANCEGILSKTQGSLLRGMLTPQNQESFYGKLIQTW
jgi:hypothetical protein